MSSTRCGPMIWPCASALSSRTYDGSSRSKYAATGAAGSSSDMSVVR
jgi:hypothetical protein